MTTADAAAMASGRYFKSPGTLYSIYVSELQALFLGIRVQRVVMLPFFFHASPLETLWMPFCPIYPHHTTSFVAFHAFNAHTRAWHTWIAGGG